MATIFTDEAAEGHRKHHSLVPGSSEDITLDAAAVCTASTL